MEGIKIELTSQERTMLLDALEHPPYLEKVQNPATKRFIRDIYRNLKAKLIFDERIHREIKESFNIK